MEGGSITINGARVFVHGKPPSARYAEAGNQRFLLRMANVRLREQLSRLKQGGDTAKKRSLRQEIRDNTREIDRLEMIMKKMLDQEKARYARKGPSPGTA